MQQTCRHPALVAILCFALSLPSLVQAADSQLLAVQYPAWVERNGVRGEALSPGMQVHAGDTLVSGHEARLLLGLPDGGSIKLGADSRFVIEHLRAPTTAAGVSVEAGFRLMSGFFRYAGTTLGKLTGRPRIDLKITTATLGIRGTDYWAMTDDVHDAVCVFDGKVEVATRDQGLIALDQPTAFWTRFFDKPAQLPGNASPAELARFIASVEPVAGNGVAIPNGRWRIVAATERQQAAAREIARALNTHGYPASVLKQQGQYEVHINHYATRADAESALKRLAASSGLTGSQTAVVLTR